MFDISEDLIGTGVQLVPESDMTYNLLASVVVESTDDHAIANIGGAVINVSLNIDGIVRSDHSAVFIFGGSDHDIFLGPTGRISGPTGIEVGEVFDASITNNGIVIADGTNAEGEGSGRGIRLFGESSGTITNAGTGTIIASQYGILVDSTNSADVVNDGLVIAQANGVRFLSNGSFTNNGTVISEMGPGVVLGASGASYTNSGSIVSQAENGVAVSTLLGFAGPVNTLFHNSGILSAVTAFDGSSANETFWNSGPNAEIIGDVDMGAGNDTFRNFAGSIDYDIHGGLGDDSLYGGSGSERFHGDDGNDYFELGGGDDIAYGGVGEDIVFAQGGSDTIYGGAGADIIHGNTGDDMLYGNAGLDELYGGANNDTLSGGSDTDFLYGSIGHDTLIGGSGADALYGGPGTDTLIGGTGLDLFYMLGFFGDDDVIADFRQADGDIIVLNASTADSLIDVLEASTNVNGDTFVDFGNNQSFTIEGIRPAELMADDFIFNGVVD